MKNKKIYIPIIILGIAIIFFSYAPIITFDTSHYLWLSNLLTPSAGFADWDMARGIVFPLIIYISNILFSASAEGLLITMFIAYITMISFVYLIFKKINKNTDLFNNRKRKIILVMASILLIIFNPIIFGYYHTLLTEFIAITLAVVMCYLAWNWTEIDFKKSKLKYILYTLVFALGTAFAWNLKQPYVGCVIFPLIVATIISIIQKFNIKNILQRIITIITCIVMLVLSLIIWNKILEYGQVPMQEDRTSSSFLSNGIIQGISQLEFTMRKENVDLQIIETTKISENEKQEIKKIIEGNSEYNKFLLYKNKNEKSKDMVLFLEGDEITTGESIKFWFKTLFTTPMTIIRSYVNNYLCIINIFDITFIDISPIATTDLNVFGTAENEKIAYRIYDEKLSNLFELPLVYEQYALKYETDIEPIRIVNIIMKSIGTIFVLLTKLGFFILPIVLIGIIFMAIKKRENYSILIILLSFSLIHVLFHTVLGAFIDRYTVPAMIPMFISYIIIAYNMANKIKSKRTDK